MALQPKGKKIVGRSGHCVLGGRSGESVNRWRSADLQIGENQRAKRADLEIGAPKNGRLQAFTNGRVFGSKSQARKFGRSPWKKLKQRGRAQRLLLQLIWGSH